MEFTFCSQAYNHEKYIINHLESIKYQIEHFGKGINVFYIFADDCSSDNTVNVAKQWIAKHNDLFYNVKYILARENQGIVKTYTNILKEVKTQHYIILAGDDLCYKNDLFDTCKDREDHYVVITPVIHFEGNHALYNRYRFMKSVFSCGVKSDSIKNYLRRQYRYNGRLSAAGMFISHDLIDNGLYNTLNKYGWIEDAPQLFYHMNQKQSVFYFDVIPKILYRIDSGVSHHPRSEGYLKDRITLNQYVHKKRSSNPAIQWIYALMERAAIAAKTMQGKTKKTTRDIIDQFQTMITKEISEAQHYLELIDSKAEEYEKNYNK